MTTEPTTELPGSPVLPASAFEVGEPVDVHAMGYWYRGQVTKVGPSRVTVTYTSGAGNTRDKAVNPSKAVDTSTRSGGRELGSGIRKVQEAIR